MPQKVVWTIYSYDRSFCQTFCKDRAQKVFEPCPFFCESTLAQTAEKLPPLEVRKRSRGHRFPAYLPSRVHAITPNSEGYGTFSVPEKVDTKKFITSYSTRLI